MELQREILVTIAEEAVTRALYVLGLTSGEISRNKALSIYGKWFKDAISNGKIKPCRIGTGKTGTHYYSVSDILSARSEDLIKADIIR